MVAYRWKIYGATFGFALGLGFILLRHPLNALASALIALPCSHFTLVAVQRYQRRGDRRQKMLGNQVRLLHRQRQKLLGEMHQVLQQREQVLQHFNQLQQEQQHLYQTVQELREQYHYFQRQKPSSLAIAPAHDSPPPADHLKQEREALGRDLIQRRAALQDIQQRQQQGTEEIQRLSRQYHDLSSQIQQQQNQIQTLQQELGHLHQLKRAGLQSLQQLAYQTQLYHKYQSEPAVLQAMVEGDRSIEEEGTETVHSQWQRYWQLFQALDEYHKPIFWALLEQNEPALQQLAAEEGTDVISLIARLNGQAIAILGEKLCDFQGGALPNLLAFED